MKKYVAFTSIHIEFPPNYILGFCILLGFIAVTMMIGFLNISLLWQMFSVICVFLYSYYLYHQFVIYKSRAAWIGCQTISQNQWLLKNNLGSFYAAKLRADTFVSTWLIVIRWDVQLPQQAQCKASVVLFKRMLAPNVWRQLCCNLRWQAQ